MPREVFVAGQILTAAEMNIVSDQTVMSFAGTAARGSAIPTPSEGMAVYLEDSNIVSLYDGADWKNSLGVTGGILQVVSTTKTDTYTMASTTFTQPTNFNVSITPRSTSSKVLITGTISLRGTEGTNNSYARLMRDSTAIFLGDAAGSRVRGFVVDSGGGGNNAPTQSFSFLDSPNTTSAVTYSVEVRSNGATTIFVNRSQTDTDSADGMRTASTITVMEVAA